MQHFYSNNNFTISGFSMSNEILHHFINMLFGVINMLGFPYPTFLLKYRHLDGISVDMLEMTT